MAITCQDVEVGGSWAITSNSAITCGPNTLTSGSRYFLVVTVQNGGGDPAAPSCSGWDQVATSAPTGTGLRVTVLTKVGDGNSDNMVVSLGGTYSIGQCVLNVLTGTHATTPLYGTNVAYGGAVTDETAIDLDSALGTFQAGNATFFAAVQNWAAALSADSPLTRVSDGTYYMTTATAFYDGADTTPSMTSTHGQMFAALGFELQAAQAAAPLTVSPADSGTVTDVVTSARLLSELTASVFESTVVDEWGS